MTGRASVSAPAAALPQSRRTSAAVSSSSTLRAIRGLAQQRLGRGTAPLANEHVGLVVERRCQARDISNFRSTSGRRREQVRGASSHRPLEDRSNGQVVEAVALSSKVIEVFVQRQCDFAVRDVCW